MRRKYYKSLDRPLNIFGLKGNWIRVFGIGLGVAVLIAFIAGIAFGSGPGMGVFIAGIVLDFFGCIVFQAKLPSKRLAKSSLRSKMNFRIVKRTALAKVVSDNNKLYLNN